MRELFYRRADQRLGGYKVVARDAGLSGREEVFASQKAMPASQGEALHLTYKQCRLDEGIMLSCGYFDVHGSRGSGIAHVLFTEDQAEREALLDALPLSSAYFSQVREAFAADEAAIERKDHRVPLEAFVGLRGDDPRGPLKKLRTVFSDEPMLSRVFEALLDAASANPHMVAIVLEGEPIETLPGTGRCLAEALFGCLPAVTAACLGYQSPAFSLNDVTFGLRFMNQAAPARSGMSFAFLPASRQAFPPSDYKDEPGEYASELARLVMDGSDAAFDRIRALRERLNDWSMAGSRTMAQDLAMRYAFYTRRAAMTAAEVRRLLAWYHEQIDQAARENAPGRLDGSRFWADVNRWATEEYLAGAWAQRPRWNGNGGFYSGEQVRLLFEDGQKLHELNRAEAAAYRTLYARHLATGTICPADEMAAFDKHLKAYYCGQIQKARDNSFAGGQLYWDAVEAHMRAAWLHRADAWEGALGAALRRAYELSPEDHGDIAAALADHMIETNAPLSGDDGGAIREKALALIVARDRDFVAASMKRELSENPYQSASAVSRFAWYRRFTADDDALRAGYEAICLDHLNRAIAACGPDDLEALLDELEGRRGRGFSETTALILPGHDARAAVKARAAAIGASVGIHDFFPNQPEAAAIACLREGERGEEEAARPATPFAAASTAALAGAAALFGGGLTASVFGLIRMLGLI